MAIPDVEQIEKERRARAEAQMRHQRIAHYYGDSVRWLFVAVAVLLFFGLPFYPDILPFDTSVSIAFGVVLIIFAALTNPHKQWVLWCDVIISIVGVIMLESIAIDRYQIDSLLLLSFREVLALALLIALYQALKTVRAMSMHQVGKGGTTFGEFNDAG